MQHVENVVMWEHLPNAAHIDAVLKHVSDYNKRWAAAYKECSSPSMLDTVDNALDEIRIAARANRRVSIGDAAWISSGVVSYGPVRDAVHNALLALIVYDSSSELLRKQPDELRAIIAHNGETKAAAVLLLAAVIAMG